MSRPSRSQVQVRVGSYADGTPRLVTFNWQSCKPAHMRTNAQEGSRPNIGRRPDPPTDQTTLSVNNNALGENVETSQPVDNETSTKSQQSVSSPAERGKFERAKNESPVADPLPDNRPQPHPDYIKKGPIITRQMFDKWTPDLLGLPASGRPIRATRNPAPNYVDALRHG